MFWYPHWPARRSNVYLLPQKLDKTLLMGTIGVFFAVVNLGQLPRLYLISTSSNTSNLLNLRWRCCRSSRGRPSWGFWMLQRSKEKLIFSCVMYFRFFRTGGKLC